MHRSPLLFALVLVVGLPTTASAQVDPAPAPRCDGETVVISGDPETVVPLPGPCVQVATDGARIGVAAGHLGAFVVTWGEQGPIIALVPTVGSVTRVGFEEGVLVLHEELVVTRRLSPAPVAPAPPVAPLPALPLAAPPAEPSVLGEVSSIQGRRIVVTRAAGTADPPLGTLVDVGRPATSSAVREGGRVRRGRSGAQVWVAVDGVEAEHLVLLLGRGDRVRVGDLVRWGGAPPVRASARIVSPRSWRNQWAFLVEVAPGFSASYWSPGAHVMGRARAAWSAPIPLRFELGAEHLALGVRTGGRPFVGADVQLLVELDMAPFGIGLSGGYQALGLLHQGPTVGGYVRGGFRDGLHVELRARFVPGSQNVFGGVEGRGVVPFSELIGLSFEGAAGSGQGVARLGIVVHPFGQGGPGTLIINPSLGLQVMNWYGLQSRDDPWSGQYVSQVGPAATLRVEWRP